MNRRTCVCWSCRKTARGWFRTCQGCGERMETLDWKARPPKRTASDRDWARFRRRFGVRLPKRREPFARRRRKGETWRRYLDRMKESR